MLRAQIADLRKRTISLKFITTKIITILQRSASCHGNKLADLNFSLNWLDLGESCNAYDRLCNVGLSEKKTFCKILQKNRKCRLWMNVSLDFLSIAGRKQMTAETKE
jgi:hypothetical protein